MKKLFAHNKSKAVKVNQVSREPATGTEEPLIQTPIYQKLATYPKQPESSPVAIQHVPTPSRDQWEVQTEETHASSAPSLMNSRASSLALPPGASPPVPSPLASLAPRPPSPYNTISKIQPIPPPKQSPNGGREREREPSVKKGSGPALGALAALRALEPPTTTREQTKSYEDRYTPSEIDHRDNRPREPEKREKKGFWSRDKEKDKGHDRDRTEREKDQSKEEELARVIGWLAATASEDWRLVLEVCDRSSSSEANAKEAIRALRREFRYGEPAAQLSAARLWALMLRNSSEWFIAQSTTRKFLDTLEDVLNNPRTVPVVKERLLNVIAAAAFASGNKYSRGGFRGLWKRVKPADKPDEGVPFDPEDTMFTPPAPPAPSSRHSHYSDGGITPSPLDAVPTTPTGTHSPTRNRVIPLEEDIRRLLQECKIGSGNAALLSQALAMTRPEELHNKDIIKEFYQKCHSSQELIYAQIPWATSGAERSRGQRQQELEARMRDQSHDSHDLDDGGEATIEEALLDALLAANMELVSALRQFDDLERLAFDYQNKLEVRMDRRRGQQLEHENAFGIQSVDGIGYSRSPSPSAHSITRSYSPAQSGLQFSTPHAYTDSPTPASALAPPPPAPQGPRAPPSHSRTPSPAEIPSMDIQAASPSGNDPGSINGGFSRLDAHHHVMPSEPDSQNPDDDPARPAQPSAKALGKRREQQVEFFEPPKSPGSLLEASDGLFSNQENEQDSDSEKSAVNANPWHRPVHYVYDAAAERTEQRIREGHTMLVNGVH